MKTFFQMRDKTMKGGPGSGFHNHAGRPGKVGGSAKEYQYSITDRQRRVVRRFTGGDFTWMNRHLRTGSETSDSILQKIDVLKETISSAPPLESEETLFRFVSKSPSELGMQEGSIWEEKGFMSTSANDNYGSSQHTQYIIKVPKGQKILYVSGISGHQSENEVILNAGSKFKVVSIKKSELREKDFVVELEMLPKEWATKNLDFMKSTWRPWSVFEGKFISAIFNALVEQLRILIGWEDYEGIGNDNSFWSALDEILGKAIQPIVMQIATKAVRDTVNSISLTTSFEMTNTAAIEWAYLYSASEITKVNETTKKAVRKTIAEWIEGGEGVAELRKRLEELVDETGMQLFSEARAKRIAQSELTSIYAGAKAKVLEANGYRKAVFIPRAHVNCHCYIQPATVDGVKVIVWYTARDEMVCEREIETPFGTVNGCKELHRTIVSEGYAGRKLESNQWNSKKGEQ